MTTYASFVIGVPYARSTLLEFIGSKQQMSGIIWGDKLPEAVICTSGGKHGAEAAYSDQSHPDGTWSYFGQGAAGDQDPNGFANQLLIAGQRSVLLFTTREPTSREIQAAGNRKKQYTFAGEFCVGSWDTVTPIAGKRKGNKLLKFILVPISDIQTGQLGSIDEQKESGQDSLEVLRTKLGRKSAAPKRGMLQLVEYFVRSSALKRYIRLRADGRCEYCGRSAPFVTLDGVPFLEIHHILRLADDGPDAPENVIALCPNCHREAHYGAHLSNMKGKLLNIAQCKEKCEVNTVADKFSNAPSISPTDAV